MEGTLTTTTTTTTTASKTTTATMASRLNHGESAVSVDSVKHGQEATESSSTHHSSSASTKLPGTKRTSPFSNTEPAKKRQSSESSENDCLSAKLESAMTSEIEVLTVESDDNVEDERDGTGQKWFLCRPTSSASSLYWTHFQRFDTSKHIHHRDKAACKHCFNVGRYKKGTVSCKGGSTSGLKRHIEAYHLKEFESLQKKKSAAIASSSITHHLTKKSPVVAVEDVKRHFKLAATSWVIDQAIPFEMITMPSFRNMFNPLNRNAAAIVNIGRRGIREHAMTLGRFAERATELEVNGREISWTTDHWTGPNDETYSTVTAHYVGNDWKLQSVILDFKVFHGSTSGDYIYNDIEAVLKKFKGDTVMVLDTIGITDTTGNMAQ
jgi:hypothetical protein